jgi:hypothetical protein
MPTFAQVTAPQSDEDRYRPPKVIDVPPDAFASDWAERPSEAVAVGLRIIPDDDLQTARDNAAAFAARRYLDQVDTVEAVDCFNDALLRHKIARATCMPEDVRQPFFRAAEDTVRFALSTDGVKLLAQEIQLFELERSPAYKPATDDEVLDLAALLQTEAPFLGMSAIDEQAVRRLLAVVRERIGEALARVAEQSGVAATDDDQQFDAMAQG